MSLVVAFDEIPQEKIRKNPGGPDRPASTNYPFFRASPERPESPSAFLAQYDPGDRSGTHFHQVDQFQILVQGGGEFGRHQVAPYYVHFARAFTPYGPLHADDEKGWTFLTLRTRYDPGAQRLPGALPTLKAATDRKPWQVTTNATFPDAAAPISVRDIGDIADEQGLFVKSLAMAPGAKTTAPSPAGGDGQFIVVVRGSMVHGGAERRALTVSFVKPEEAALAIQAGAEGLEALVLNFPRVAPRSAEAEKKTALGFRKWQCLLCAFYYDEEKGMPEDGIAPGTRWEDVPESWTCPDCAARKDEFQMCEV